MTTDEARAVTPLHSILVKSIQISIIFVITSTILYIPFWLNLYFAWRDYEHDWKDFTFHSG